MLSLNPNDLDLLDAEHIGADSVEDDIAAGGRSVDVLTDLEFGRRHPERGGAKIQKGETALAAEWAQIRDSVVRRALRQSVAEERQGAQAARRARKLQVELMEAGRRVNEATRIAEQKARQLQALQTLQTLRGEA